jgi:ELWxxDGT repeat protein
VSIIFFNHYDPATGEELWLNSGGITKLVKDINPGPGWSNPENLTAVGGTLFFTAYDDTNGYQLWRTDGTAAGTVMLTSLAPSNSSPVGLLNVNGTLFFEANDGTHGLQLWKSDGTVTGTVMVTNLSQGLLYNYASTPALYLTKPLGLGSAGRDHNGPVGAERQRRPRRGGQDYHRDGQGPEAGRERRFHRMIRSSSRIRFTA